MDLGSIVGYLQQGYTIGKIMLCVYSFGIFIFLYEKETFNPGNASAKDCFICGPVVYYNSYTPSQ